ncbi:MAG: hypothetical protein A3B37_01485 [Candidatus Sungbacteria bacterium RIFCSPLOWO2_01_FULL_59_16]|uniref:TrbC/VIRB2 family protein n=1 Tax=Candidatus Sungbacteria bacterium RIFCSPLOWO2_01_FULL_59_16 TaxID=1802280 RepID=A0A1G2LCC1_9BACT|nr:MAG: hypothetical protein A3B37_01485 [Candidatus Sungbacteria bacterium RIFCSPLOWO2_01_FULL_59_16]
MVILALTISAETIPPPTGNLTITDIINNIIDFAIRLVVPISVIMVLLAGFFYMTAGGSEEKVRTAHKTLLWAVIGTAIVLSAKAVIVIVKGILGIS